MSAIANVFVICNCEVEENGGVFFDMDVGIKWRCEMEAVGIRGPC